LGNYGNDNYVYYSANGGNASPVFNSIQSNLPKAPVYSGLIEMHGNNAIVGTDIGVFSTANLTSGNPQWTPDMSGIGNVVVTDIRQQSMRDYHILNYGVIYMATYGLGLWMEDTYYEPVGIDENRISTSKFNNLSITPNPADNQITISSTQDVSGQVMADIYDMTGRVVLNQSLGFKAKGEFTGIVNISALPAGSYILKVGSAVGKLIKK
jgi:hypothetical protein